MRLAYESLVRLQPIVIDRSKCAAQVSLIEKLSAYTDSSNLSELKSGILPERELFPSQLCSKHTKINQYFRHSGIELNVHWSRYLHGGQCC